MSDEGGDESLIVAVRCRPFNSREKAGDASLVVQMVDKQTIMTDPENQDSNNNKKTFTFDYSFWSHNKNDSHFVDNDFVYNNVGKKVLKAAWEGYNSSLFAVSNNFIIVYVRRSIVN